MLNKNERMNKLNNAGVNTGKYFTLDLPEGVTAGSKIHVIIDEKGNYVPQIINDAIVEQIIEDGYVRNTKLHRRFVMAQMFQGLNYKSYDGRREGYTEWLKTRGFKYSFDMMLEEVRVLGKLEKADRNTFLERSHFFSQYVIVETMKDYMAELEKYVDTLHVYKCKGVPYKKIKGRDVFVADLEKKIYAPLRREIVNVQFHTHSHNDIHRYLKNFVSNMISLPWNTPKSKVWIDAYKGAGAFYTLKNLLAFHNCFVVSDSGAKLYGASAVKYLETKLNEYHNEGWRMFALLKKVIKDNNFDFNKKMEEIYNK